VIGTGADGRLPVVQDVCEQARRREVDLVILPTAQAISLLAKTTPPAGILVEKLIAVRLQQAFPA
jgi:hypothetical protein